MRHVNDGKVKVMREGGQVLASITDKQGQPVATTLLDRETAREVGENLIKAADEPAEDGKA